MAECSFCDNEATGFVEMGNVRYQICLMCTPSTTVLADAIGVHPSNGAYTEVSVRIHPWKTLALILLVGYATAFWLLVGYAIGRMT